MPALGHQFLRGDRWCMRLENLCRKRSRRLRSRDRCQNSWLEGTEAYIGCFYVNILNRADIPPRAQRCVVCLSLFAFVGVEQCSCETLCFLMMGYSDVVALALKKGSSSKRDHESESSQDLLLLSRDPKKLWFGAKNVVFADYKRLEKVH